MWFPEGLENTPFKVFTCFLLVMNRKKKIIFLAILCKIEIDDVIWQNSNVFWGNRIFYLNFFFQIFSAVEIVRGRRFALWWSCGAFQEKANKQWYRFVQTLHWSPWEKGRQNRRWTRKGTHFFNTILISIMCFFLVFWKFHALVLIKLVKELKYWYTWHLIWKVQTKVFFENSIYLGRL